MRYGTRSLPARFWTPPTVRPCGNMNIGYEYRYLYVAIAPATGDVFALMMPSMETICFDLFLQQFAHHLRQIGIEHTDQARLILDNAGAHHAIALQQPDNILLEFLPPYSPELNPCERFFEEIRRATKSSVFATIEDIELVIIETLQRYWLNPKAVVQLTYWDWMKHNAS